MLNWYGEPENVCLQRICAYNRYVYTKSVTGVICIPFTGTNRRGRRLLNTALPLGQLNSNHSSNNIARTWDTESGFALDFVLVEVSKYSGYPILSLKQEAPTENR